MKKTIVNESDPRIVKTKKQLLQAFKELLLLYDDFMNITVKELCDKAGVSRKTFYFHFNQVDELLSIVEDEYIKDFYERTKDFDYFQDLEKIVEAYFDLNESVPLYKKIATSSVYFYNKEFFRKKAISYFASNGKILINDKLSATAKDFLFYYYDLTMYTMYKRWVIKKYPLSKEEAITLTANLLRNGVSSLVKDQ